MLNVKRLIDIMAPTSTPSYVNGAGKERDCYRVIDMTWVGLQYQIEVLPFNGIHAGIQDMEILAASYTVRYVFNN